jgi:hypothetical protein
MCACLQRLAVPPVSSANYSLCDFAALDAFLPAWRCLDGARSRGIGPVYLIAEGSLHSCMLTTWRQGWGHMACSDQVAHRTSCSGVATPLCMQVQLYGIFERLNQVRRRAGRAAVCRWSSQVWALAQVLLGTLWNKGSCSCQQCGRAVAQSSDQRRGMDCWCQDLACVACNRCSSEADRASARYVWRCFAS